MYYSNPYMGYAYKNPTYNKKSLDNSLKLIKEGVIGEKSDELFYNYLISIAPDEEDKEIITSIRDDELKHNRMFRQIYKDYTGQEIGEGENIDFEKTEDYIDGIVKALFGELKAVEKYREIRAGLPTRNSRDMLFEIITDELKHASKYNYLYTKNIASQGNEVPNNCIGSGNKTVSKTYTLDEWSKIIDPLVEKSNYETYDPQEIILISILIGSGYTPEEAIEKVSEWENC